MESVFSHLNLSQKFPARYQWVLLFLVIFAGYQPKSMAIGFKRLNTKCNQILESHFPGSVMWQGKPNSQFSQWAAETAKKVSAEFRRGSNFYDVMTIVANSRRNFQNQIGSLPEQLDSDSGIGIYRFDISEQGLTWLASLDPDFELAGERLHIAKFVREKLPQLFVKDAEPYVPIVWTIEHSKRATQLRLSYKKRDGTNLPSTIIVNKDDVLIAAIHPTGYQALEIFRDVGGRVEQLLKQPDRREFYLAAHGYFNAMPFDRGSAAIGRVFFTGLYQHLFGEPIALDPEIDVKAMLSSQEDFVDQFLK